jgi:hypothetical protein
MKRTNYREPIPRCQAVSKKTKKRCTLDATCQHAGKAYCSRHHVVIMKELTNEPKP